MLKQKIQNCKKCPLYQHMPFTPIVGDIYQRPIMLILENLTEEATILDQSFSVRHESYLKRNFDLNKIYITTLVKCLSKLNKRDISNCKEWLFEEIKEVQPKKIISMGSKFIKLINLDINIGTSGIWNNIEVFHTKTINSLLNSHILNTRNIQEFINDI